MRLEARTGSWTGTNAFRLRASDPPRTATATAQLSARAGGHLTSIAYAWSHPDDGPQEGLLVLGPGPDGSTLALWGDTWHQTPQARILTGSTTGDVASVGYDYVAGEWRWQVVVDATQPGVLRLRMDNLALARGDEPCAAMDAVLRPA